MKMMIILIFIISSAFAQDCAPKNLITAPNSPFQKLPVYDQGKSGQCYAYTVVQMYDYHRLKKGALGRNAHPAWASLSYTNAKNVDLHHGGVIKGAYDALISNGLCGFDEVEAALRKWTTKAKMSEQDLLSFIELIGKSLESKKNMTKILTGSNKLTSREVNEAIDESTLYCPIPGYEQFIPELKKFEFIFSRELLSKMIAPNCQNVKKPIENAPKAIEKRFRTDQEFSSAIQNQLLKSDAPVGIGYCFTATTSTDKIGIKPEVDRRKIIQQRELTEDCGPHASIIVGQKKINNSCHFLVRNTAGTQWNENNKNLKCVCQNIFDMSYVDNCTPQTHSNDTYIVEGCWVDSARLLPNMLEITYLEESRPLTSLLK